MSCCSLFCRHGCPSAVASKSSPLHHIYLERAVEVAQCANSTNDSASMKTGVCAGTLRNAKHHWSGARALFAVKSYLHNCGHFDLSFWGASAKRPYGSAQCRFNSHVMEERKLMRSPVSHLCFGSCGGSHALMRPKDRPAHRSPTSRRGPSSIQWLAGADRAGLSGPLLSFFPLHEPRQNHLLHRARCAQWSPSPTPIPHDTCRVPDTVPEFVFWSAITTLPLKKV